MELQIRLLNIDVQTFQMVSTNPIPLYSPLSFGIGSMVFHIKASVMFLKRYLYDTYHYPEGIRKLISISNPYSTQKLKELTIGGKLYCQFNI